MKLLRYGPAGSEKPGLLDADGKIRDLSGTIGDVAGAALSDESLAKLAKLAKLDTKSLPLVDGNPRLGPCVGNVGKFICIGLNFADHAAESNLPVPTEPVVFLKATSAICGPYDDVLKPRGATKLDWEVEFGVVIGKKASYVSEADALDHVAGYCVINDVSERNFQTERPGGQWDKGKGCDTFGPLGPCVGNVGKFICIGLNFADHAAESNLPVPTEPVVFLKATSAICGPYDDVLKPRGATKLDWEVEFGVVIGKKASYVSEADALDHVAGYCVINDVSERNFQTERPGGQWDKGKGCDTFGPLGPWLVTKDEAGDINNLKMWLEVNGKRFQDGSTKTMVFRPAYLISYLSNFFTLHPGDVISTGTPPGVGLGQKPPLYLNAGDVMHLGIENLGEQKQKVIPA